MLTRSVCAALVAAVIASGPASAQQPPAADNGVEVLARGPVHEAFAATAELPIAGPVVPKLPPRPVDELPPDQKPAGENVTWVPGYWHWDEERTDFIWISGFWRVPPPGRVWVPGSWREVQGGWQWVQGFWQGAATAGPVKAAVATEIQYLPPPPQPLEVAPSVPAPSATSFYVPGTWMWRQRYVWRPGFWIDYRPGWVWTAAHYRYTPAGYVFVDGYWDHPLETRGVLFAPVAFAPVVIARPAFVYTPVYCVPPASLYTSLFVRRGWGAYYFGDYFEPRYATVGFSAWIGGRNGGFAVSVGVGRPAPAFDPMWAYYQAAHRHDPAWAVGVTNVYAGRFRGELPPPPRTLVQQNVVVNNITNTTVVNNTVVNNTVINKPTVNNLTMVAPITAVQQTNPAVALRPVQRDERVREQQAARQLNEMAANRQRLESGLANRGVSPTQPSDRPRQVKLDVPQTFVARAQVSAAPDKAPPLPAARLAEMGTNTPARTPPVKDFNPAPPSVIPPAKTTQPTRPVQPVMPPAVVPPGAKPTTLPVPAPSTTTVPPVAKPSTLPPVAKPATLPPATPPGSPVVPQSKKPAGPMPPQMGLPTLPSPTTPGKSVPMTPPPVRRDPAPATLPVLPPARPVVPAPVVPPSGRPTGPAKPAPVKPPEKKSDDRKGSDR